MTPRRARVRRRARAAPDRVPRFSVRYLDRRASPARDFYRYATGRWVDANPVPADRSRWSAFDELRERNTHLLREILEERATGRRRLAGASDRQVGDFYAAAIDRRERNRRGLAPIAGDLRRIDGATSIGELLDVVADLHRDDLAVLFAPWVTPDWKSSSRYALYLHQGGLALPDRDYYLLPAFAGLRGAYRRHLERMLRFVAPTPAAARRGARAVYRIEEALARAGRRSADLRDVRKNYHRVRVTALARRHPRLRWSEYLRRLGARGLREVVVGQPEFFDRLHQLLGSVPIDDWKWYVRWQLLHAAAPHLSARIDREDFDFFHRRLLGQPRPEPDWRRAVTLVDAALGEALGRIYVERYFPPESRQRMLELVDDLRAVFRDRLAQLPWMSAKTRAQALAKFRRFEAYIGHPKRYRSYARVRVDPHDHLGNVRRAGAFDVARNVARIGKTVDREEWQMTPPTVNAHFVPTQNQIKFPAGILQPPFFDPAADDAVNYGGIGVVIGHEITHGFDDQGREFDAEGNLRDWWGPKDAREFTRRAARIVAQYDRFEPLPGMHVNGRLTMGENIADLGGVSVAFEALTRRLGDGRTDVAPVDGFSPAQRFFLSYGQIWRWNVRPDELKRRLTTDPHSPGNYRVNGPLANLPEFWAAFGVPAGAAMRQEPRRRVEIW